MLQLQVLNIEESKKRRGKKLQNLVTVPDLSGPPVGASFPSCSHGDLHPVGINPGADPEPGCVMG